MQAAAVSTTPSRPEPSHLRAFLRFVVAALYFFLARIFAHHGAAGLVSQDWAPLLEQGMLVFLLLLGYAGMSFVLDRQLYPVSKQGFPLRRGWLGEIGLGVADRKSVV